MFTIFTYKNILLLVLPQLIYEITNIKYNVFLVLNRFKCVYETYKYRTGCIYATVFIIFMLRLIFFSIATLVNRPLT